MTIDYLTDEELALVKKFGEVMCPVIRLGIRSKHINLCDEGRIASKELLDFMAFVGLDPEGSIINRVISRAVEISKEKDGIENTIKLSHLNGTPLDHGSTSGAFRYDAYRKTTDTYFSAAAVERIKKAASDGLHIDLDDLAKLTNDFHRCPFRGVPNGNTGNAPTNSPSTPRILTTMPGVVSTTFEYAILLHLFGHPGEGGKKYFLLEDIERIWKQSKFPKHWSPPLRATFDDKKFIRKTLEHGWKRLKLFKRSGRQKVDNCNDMAINGAHTTEGDV